jgi:hypothetical protein
MNIEANNLERFLGEEYISIVSVSGIDESFTYVGVNGELEELEEYDEEYHSNRLLEEDADQGEEDLSIPFVWQSHNITGKKIFFKLTFLEPGSLSQTTHGNDYVEFEMKSNPLIRSKESGIAYEEDASNNNFELTVFASMDSESIKDTGNTAMAISNVL